MKKHIPGSKYLTDSFKTTNDIKSLKASRIISAAPYYQPSKRLGEHFKRAEKMKGKPDKVTGIDLYLNDNFIQIKFPINCILSIIAFLHEKILTS